MSSSQIEYFGRLASGVPPLAVRAGDFIFFAGGIAAHPKEGMPEEVKPHPAYPYHVTQIERESRYIYKNMSRALEAAGSSMRNVMQINSFVVNDEDIHIYQGLKKDFFGVETPPCSTRCMIPGTAVPGTCVTNDAIALALDAELPREATHKHTDKTPLPIHDQLFGHPQYMQAIRGGGFIFTEGKTGAEVPIGTGSEPKYACFEEVFGYPGFPNHNNQIKLRTEYVLNYFNAVLESMGASLEHIVKAEVWKVDRSDIAGVNEVWRKFFPSDPPARIIPPSRVQMPLRYIEIELIAVDPKGPYGKENIFTSSAPESLGHEPQAIKAGPFLFFSGQMATDYKQGLAPEARVDANFPFYSSGIKQQAEYILKNVEAICQEAGTSIENLVRRRAIHSDLNELAEAEEVWREKLGDRLPPTTIFAATEPLEIPGCTVEYDLIAFIPSELERQKSHN